MSQEVKYVQLTKWAEFTDHPSYGTMRNIVARRKDNGAEEFLCKINGRFYINIDNFYHWMEKQKG